MCSYKFKKAAYVYELALSIHDNNLVWISGPYPAGNPDIVVFRKSGIKDKIPAGMKGIADNGYRGEPNVLSTPNQLDSKELKLFKQRARAHHETFNGRIKNFKCLDTRFRHTMEKHKTVFEAVCVICQYQMDAGFTLFKVQLRRHVSRWIVNEKTN